MDLTQTRTVLPRVILREQSPSTNAELRELVLDTEATPGERLPSGTVLLTTEQTAGRGRLDRGWVTPEHTSVAVSLLLRPSVELGAGLGFGWVPLLAGAAVTSALQPRFGAGMRVGVKWPNDVHVRDEADAMAGRQGKKLCGILCELLPGAAGEPPAIIVGTGINLFIDEAELPTERATSLLAAGADVGGAESLRDAAGQEVADQVIARYAVEMQRLIELAISDPAAARARVLRSSLTLGTEVRVHLAGDEIVDGHARTLADDGSLVVDLPTGGVLTVSAGDVEHLR